MPNDCELLYGFLVVGYDSLQYHFTFRSALRTQGAPRWDVTERQLTMRR